MKRFFLALCGAAMLFGSVTIRAEASDTAGYHHADRHHHRHRVCRVEWVKKVVWWHHHRRIHRYKAYRCHWV